MARSAKRQLLAGALLLQLLQADDYNYTADAPCAAPVGVANAEAVPCGEGLFIPGGGNCTAMCQLGYKSSEISLACGLNGTLTPLTFECEELQCFAPLVQHGDPSGATCVEGLEVAPGTAACTPLCECGYIASEVSLSCSKGQLYPDTFFLQRDQVCERYQHAVRLATDGYFRAGRASLRASLHGTAANRELGLSSWTRCHGRSTSSRGR